MIMTLEHSETRLEMNRFIGRHVNKEFDWNAFPRSKGHPELGRAQMRYIGAGGSPKVDDPNTLKPEHFTLSMINLPVGHFGASHYHDDCEEIFLMLEGIVTVGFAWGDEVIELSLGPKDLIMLPVDLPHGYRNDSAEPVRFSVMVGSNKPNLPIYVAHPTQSERALAFGAAPGKTQKLARDSTDPRHRQLRGNLIRYCEQPVNWHPAGFGWKVYVGEGGAPAGNFRENLIHLPCGKGVRPYAREVEDAYLVLEGVVTVGWEVDGRMVEETIGPKDVIFNPAGRLHYFRNDGFHDAQFMMVVGTSQKENVAFEPIG
jgi:mannose-6-phosphate isomerase-like protein (cupin superfamily)